MSADRLVLFDGECGVCDRAVHWLMVHDTERRLRYAPLQGETAAALRARFAEIPQGIDTMVFVDLRGAGRCWLRSQAVLAICAELPAPWRWAGVFRWIPRPILDIGYRAVAAVRRRILPPPDACALPTPEERALLLP